VVLVLLLPVAFVGVALVAAVVCVRGSSLRITSAGVEIRNYPQAVKLIPLVQVGHFEETTPVGNFKSLRPATAVLVLADGSRVPVRTVTAPDAGHGVAALNARVEALRTESGRGG
jgi:hypothetical protein